MARARSAQTDRDARCRSYDKVSFYFAAHEDDWQLFMNPSAFADVADVGTKVVFVHVTAGDAGLGVGSGGRKHPYYLAREHGAKTAIRFMADADDLPVGQATVPVRLNGRRVHRVTYRNTVGYFLRLPDGNPAGTGYPTTGGQSLKLLADGRIKALSAIDGSAVYHGWTDLVSTVRALLDVERQGCSSVALNVPELDATINPDDHSDHVMTARVALDAAREIGARRVHHAGYATSRLPENLAGRPRDEKSAVYAVTLAAILAFDHGTAWHHYSDLYIGRSYFRVEDDLARQAPGG